MAAHFLRGDASASGCPKALLLRGEAASPEDEKLAALLDVLGVSWEAVRAKDIASRAEWNAPGGEPFCVMSPASCMAALVGPAANAGGALPDWMAKAESVYVYGFLEDNDSQSLLRFLTGDPCANVRSATAQQSFVSVTGDFPEMCGPMSGIQFQARTQGKQSVFDLCPRTDSFQSILSASDGHLFVAMQREGAQLFLNASTNVIDVAALCTKYFDVRENFFDTAPIVMYVKWVFGADTASEISACLIVDDPPLKPRYGFLKYQDALRLMDEHNFAMTVAFIPWNWRRTDARTVRLFHEHPNRLSVCIHGCDHTAKEFAERSAAVLNKRINVASQRMRLFGRRTQLRHDDIMLFPQGAFSAGAARALKLNGFVAAANTEVVPVHKDENKTTVGDLLSLAITKYASFPVFTRRYLAHGVENFAFDGLLGKPCFIAAHHDDFAGDARILLQVIAKLNSLNWNLRWRSLGDAISHSFSVRTRGKGERCVEMYGAGLIYKNSHESAQRTTFIKEESDFDCVKAVTVNGQPVDYLHQRGYLRFEAMVPANERADLRILYSSGQTLPAGEDGLNYRAKAVLRRYLSEFRDNYLSRNAHLQQGAIRIKEALRL
ncbi:MAG: hypothetical protein JWO71_742 [Candidatus Acidoferrum typicum]|nr:hypothetical protein [Candidatus Acidoferrum typicum]